MVCYFLSLWKASYCLESQGSYTLRSVCFLQLTHRWRINTPRNFFRCSYHIEWSGLAMKADRDTLEGTSSLKHSLPSWTGLFIYRSYRLINLSFFNVSKRVINIILVTNTQWITVTVRLLKPGPLVEDYPITAFFESKILNFFFFFANGLIKFNYAAVENFKTVWSYLTSQETAIKFMNVICSFAKKLKILLFSKNVVSLQSSSKCHGSSSHTVWSETSRHFINDYDLSNQHTKKFGITVWFVLAFHLF